MSVADLASNVLQQITKVIHGQERTAEHVLICLLARGHALVEGVPGLAKTLLAKCLAHTIGGEFRRVQFTPDLMPSDVTGTNVFDARSASFHLRRGPVFCNVLLADEINRTPPKTQSALLEAMEERVVTIDGTGHPLPSPFFVIATQNPIEHEGTYPLPEAQLDRFLMKVVLDYPQPDAEARILRMHDQGLDPHDLTAMGVGRAATLEQAEHVQAGLAQVTVQDDVLRYVAEIVRRTRQLPQLVVGASPRAGVALLLCSKALAALRGRDFVTPDDVKEMTYPVLRHRLILQPEAELEQLTADRLLESVLAAVPVPR